MKLRMEKSAVYTVPALDRKGKPVVVRVKFGNRDMEIEAQDHVRLAAGDVVNIDGDDDICDELIAKGLATEFDPVMDDEGGVLRDPARDGFAKDRLNDGSVRDTLRDDFDPI